MARVSGVEPSSAIMTSWGNRLWWFRASKTNWSVAGELQVVMMTVASGSRVGGVFVGEVIGWVIVICFGLQGLAMRPLSGLQ